VFFKSKFNRSYNVVWLSLICDICPNLPFDRDLITCQLHACGRTYCSYLLDLFFISFILSLSFSLFSIYFFYSHYSLFLFYFFFFFILIYLFYLFRSVIAPLFLNGLLESILLYHEIADSLLQLIRSWVDSINSIR